MYKQILVNNYVRKVCIDKYIQTYISKYRQGEKRLEKYRTGKYRTEHTHKLI